MSRFSPQARVLAALIAGVALTTLVVHVQLGLARHGGRALAAELWRIARYFTILTDVLVGLVFARVALLGRMSPVWLAGLTLWIGIVAVVYHTLLARELSGLRLLVDHGFHSVLPAMVLVWWLAFAPKTGLRHGHAVWWLSRPALYMAYALARGQVDGRHPYFFLDPPLIGWPKVLMWCVALGAVFWLAGQGLVVLARWLSAGRPHPADGGPADPRPRSPRDRDQSRADG